MDPVAREALLAKRAAAAKERDKKTAAKREAQRSEQEKKERIAHTKQLQGSLKNCVRSLVGQLSKNKHVLLK